VVPALVACALAGRGTTLHAQAKATAPFSVVEASIPQMQAALAAKRDEKRREKEAAERRKLEEEAACEREAAAVAAAAARERERLEGRRRESAERAAPAKSSPTVIAEMHTSASPRWASFSTARGALPRSSSTQQSVSSMYFTSSSAFEFISLFESTARVCGYADFRWRFTGAFDARSSAPFLRYTRVRTAP
jgi:hypothetical protein